MPLRHLVTAALSASALVGTVRAQASTCPKPNAPPDSAPSVAPGFRIEVVARGLRKPRGIIFDREGGLLVVERNRGISRLTLTGDGACVQADGNVHSVVEDKTLEHGIAFSEDGNTLYASSYSTAYAWDYDASQGRTTSDPRVIVQGMGPYENHTTRTLLMSKAAPGMLVVSRGSVGNIDPLALDKTSGRATIKAFNVTNMTGSAYGYASSGLLLGWGLRNSAGVAEDPASGAIYSVENSVDDIERNGQLINDDNPGEELNFHGYLNGHKSDVQGGNYGYPYCYAAWNPSQIPGYKGVVGEQFAIGDQNDTANDEICKKKYIAPRLALQAHTAPLDIKFNPSGTAAWVTMHGSWNREEPAGYKLLFIPFDGKGSPKAPSTSTTAGTDIIFDTELSECPRSTSCFRPVGLAWDSKGRLFVSGDQAGEIYVVTKEDGSGVADVSDAGKVKDGGYEGGKPAHMEAGPEARESAGSSDKQGVMSRMINQDIAHNLDDDKNIALYRLICRATNNAVNADNMSFWRTKFREKYNFVDGPSNNQLRRVYQDRSKMLRCGTQYEFFRGHGSGEAHAVRVLRDLIVESFQGTSEVDKYGRPCCKNHAHLIDFIQESRIISNGRSLPEPSEDEPAHMDQTLAAVKLMCSHFIFNLPELEHNIFAFHESQFAVYQSAIVAPIFSTDHQSVNLEWLLHCMNFCRHYITDKELLSGLYCTSFNLLSAWQGPLLQGSQPLTKSWMGTYSYLMYRDFMQLRNQGPDPQEVYVDMTIQEGMFQYIDLFFPQGGQFANGRKLKWPRLYERQLRSLCNDNSKELNETKGEYLVKSTQSIQFEGEGTNFGDDCTVLGWLNPLPPQGGIPGWQRITFAKQFLDQNSGNDEVYAYEGVVLPDGRIILGRWWLVSDDVPNVDEELMRPFILWAIGEPGFHEDDICGNIRCSDMGFINPYI